jgi:peroxiredoxin
MNSTQPATHRSPSTRRISMTVVLLTALLAFGVHTALAAQPAVGQKAPDFTLSTPEGVAIHFSDLTGQGDVVLVLLRGYPGYQCPYCQKQVHDFVVNADKFAQAQAQVLLVYPGPSAALDQRAKEFLGDQKLPANFHLVLDPDYAFTKLYDLRWDAPHETAYPSTFLVDRHGSIFFAKTSRTHGDRVSAADALTELQQAHH